MELCCAFIDVMQATEDRLCNDLARRSGCGSGVGQRSRAGRLLIETAMRPVMVVIDHERVENLL